MHTIAIKLRLTKSSKRTKGAVTFFAKAGKKAAIITTKVNAASMAAMGTKYAFDVHILMTASR